MKKIIWTGSATAGLALTALLLATASAGDVVVRDISNGEMTNQQAATLFGAYASERCPAAASTVRKVGLVRCDTEDTAQYCDICAVRVSLTPAQAVTQMENAASDDTLTVTIIGADGDNLLVRGVKRGQLTPAQAMTWFGSYVSAGCGIPASQVKTIRVSREDDGFSHACKGLKTMTIEDARDALPSNTDAHRIEIVGLVVEE